MTGTSWLKSASLALALIYLGWMLQGWRKDAVIAGLQLTDAKNTSAAATKLTQANRRNRELEHTSRQQLARRTEQLKKEIDNAKADHHRFIAGVRNGTIRLSIPVVACDRTGPAADPAAPAGNRHPARAELDREAAADLATIANDGDDGIRQLNACIASYNLIRERFNGQAR